MYKTVFESLIRLSNIGLHFGRYFANNEFQIGKQIRFPQKKVNCQSTAKRSQKNQYFEGLHFVSNCLM